MARRLIAKLSGQGYLLGDKNYHAWDLVELAWLSGHVLLSRRKDQGAGIAHGSCWRRPRRLALLTRLEVWQPARRRTLAQSLLRQRGQIERDFAHLTSFGAGLTTGLPAWVRRIWRVRRWVSGKLIINACRIHVNRANRPQTAVVA